MDRAAISTTVTELPESRVRVLAEVSPDELRRSIDRSARELGRNLRVAGFRKGKIPAPVIIQRLGRETVVDRAVQDGLKHWWRVALDGAGIASVGQPRLDVVTAPTDDAPLTFSIEIGVRPVAELGSYKGLEVGRREPEIEPGAVDAELEALRVRVARPLSVNRPAQSGDLLVIDFNGLIDGEPFDGGRGRDQMVELGSGMLIAGFEEQLVGATTGETRTVNIDFPNVDSPKDHRAEDVAGSRASFEVRVKDVLAKKLPELDDALAQEAGCDTLGELREEIAAGLLAIDQGRVAAEFGATALDAVAEAATVELPAALVGARAQEIWETTLRTLDYDGVSREVYLQIAGKTEDEALGELRAQAAVELRREAVVAAIADAEGITVSDEDLRAHEARVEAAAESDDDDGPPSASQSRVVRCEQVLRERVLELLAREAVGISVEDAQASGKPWPRQAVPELPELPEPEEPPQAGAATG